MNENLNNSILPINQVEKNEGKVSLMEIIGILLKNWKWLLIGILVTILISFIYLSYKTPVYNITSSIVLKEAESSMMAPGLNPLSGLGMMGAVTNVDNEIYILQSRSTIRSTIKQLKLYTSYLPERRKKDVDLYNMSPIVVDMEEKDWETLEHNIKLSTEIIEGKKIHVKGKIKNQDEETNNEFIIDKIFDKLPALLTTPYGNISFMWRENIKDYKYSDDKINVIIQNPNDAIDAYRKNIYVDQVSKYASVLDMALHTPYPNKGKDFLTTLVQVYNNDAIEDKNQEALNTQRFIEDRIIIIDRELSDAEKNVEDFKEQQGLTNIASDIERNVGMSTNYEQQLVQVETQLNIVNSLNDYINNAGNADKTIPSNIGIQDPTLAATTTEYNRLLLERKRMEQSMTEDNPALKNLNERIDGLKTSINSSINSVQNALQIQRRDVRNQANMFGGRMSRVPTQERKFLELSREQQIKASLFLMLLEKREENALALAATANKAKVLDEPRKEKEKVAPKTSLVLLIALLLGLLIPAAILYLKDMFQYRIRNRADVDKISKVPLLVEIPTHDEDENIAVQENETREIDEAFRMARTNLMLTLGSENKVVIFTSTVSGEGKSFVALNMAISIALLSKRVLLIGMDLRIPKLKDYLNLTTDNGLTNYLSGFEKNIDNLIIPSGVHPNLFVLPAGPIPPNPSELLSRPTLDKAIQELRNEFDFIFIDSAPASQVTDTLIINRISDATVYVARANYSSKGNLRFANELMQKGKLRNMLLVLNDVSDFQSGYGYGYGRGYGYGYGKTKKKKKGFKKLFKR